MENTLFDNNKAYTIWPDSKYKAAFTLAEVLITLGIIGVVVALTMPSLIEHHNKRVVEARLAKFYTTFNQAIKLAEVQYGDKKDWYDPQNGSTTDYDEDGNVIEGSNELDNFFQKYLSSFITYKKKFEATGQMTYFLSDGSAFRFSAGGEGSARDLVFIPGGDINKCKPTSPSNSGVCFWVFNFYPNNTSSSWKYLYDKGLEPFKYNWDGTREYLMNDSTYGCNSGATIRSYCTALIQINGWKIPNDYPFKVHP